MFATRYSDIWLPHRVDFPNTHHALWYWNLVLKLLYITSSLYTVLIMMKVFARTREREKAWKTGAYCLGGAVASAPFVCMIFENKDRWSFFEVGKFHLTGDGAHQEDHHRGRRSGWQRKEAQRQHCASRYIQSLQVRRRGLRLRVRH